MWWKESSRNELSRGTCLRYSFIHYQITEGNARGSLCEVYFAQTSTGISLLNFLFFVKSSTGISLLNFTGITLLNFELLSWSAQWSVVVNDAFMVAFLDVCNTRWLYILLGSSAPDMAVALPPAMDNKCINVDCHADCSFSVVLHRGELQLHALACSKETKRI